MSRKTQIGWMSVGVLLTVFSIGLTLKLRDGNKAVAREEDKPVGAVEKDKQPPSALQLPAGVTPAVPPPVTVPPPDGPESSPPSPPVVSGSPLPPIKPAEPMPAPDAPPPAPPVGLTPPLPTPQLSSGPMPPEGPPPPKPSLPDQNPDFSSPRKEVVPVGATAKQEPGEPPMVVPAGPVQTYQVRTKTETLPDIARRTLGSSDRVGDILRLNPDLKPDTVLPLGAIVRLPADACVAEDPDAVKPLPSLRAKTPAAKPKILPLTGTFACNLDEHKNLTLPKAIRDQLGNCDTVLVSPGPDHCLWLTNHTHLERLSERIEQSPAREADVRVFKRLYYAQTEKTPVTAEGRVAVSDKLAQFAGLSQELVIVGIDEHFEIWDAAHWKQYTQQKSAAARSEAAEDE